MKRANVQGYIWNIHLFKNLQNNTIYYLWIHKHVGKKIQMYMVMTNIKLMTVVNTEEGDKKTGLGRVHRPQLYLYLFLLKKEANVEKINIW